ncbi:MAG: OmpA family protein [Paludibacteraceae bacterium]|nr:OmpA family protein [Paludibacteraceae bacterium]
MKRIISIFWSVVVVLSVSGQTKLPQVRTLESKGWSVQHSVMSWDSLSIYFSAQAPGASNYDLYVQYADGWRWGEPQRIDAISTGENEYWPSISSDERMLFYVTNNQIWRAWYRDGQWTEPAPLIITGNDDTKPTILEDNVTLYFSRHEESKKGPGLWQLYSATMMDDHNWILPIAVETAPAPQPIVTATGSITMVKSGRPLTKGKVMVYDATDEQLLQTARVHGVTGHWRVALQRNRHYRLALTAEGYSYHYIDIRTDGVEAREERNFGAIALDDHLALTVNTYDAETQQILNSTRHNLPLGKIHEIPLRTNNYEDTMLVVNTKRPTVFTQTELDVAMRPKKSVHHFIVSNARTGARIEEVNMRLNGKETAADTALYINKEQALQVTAPGYLFYDTLFNTGADTRERVVRVALQPLEKDLVLQLRNIQFEYDSYELTESSNEQLEAVAQLLFMNPSLHIELSSHTDDQGSDRYNDKLSTLRGQAVAQWLKERGVSESRIVAVGYGKRKPLVTNDSEENRALNRRVEVKILEF